MIQAIEQRRQTMLKVMNYIVDRQREFFEKGVQYLKPLTLREVAEVINMHESTVSRVTNEKYVQTPRGVLPLKFFFSSGLATADGEDVSARGIKAQIQKMVQDEDPKHPLTDQAIVEHPAGERRADRAAHRREVSRPARRAVGADAEAHMSRAGGSRRDTPSIDRRARPVDSAACCVPAAKTRPRISRCSWSRRQAHVAASPVRYEFVVIDDGSIDGTWERAPAACRSISVSARGAAPRRARDRRALRTGYLHSARQGARVLSGGPAVQAGGHPAARRADPRGRRRTWSRDTSKGSTRKRSCPDVYNR